MPTLKQYVFIQVILVVSPFLILNEILDLLQGYRAICDLN